MTEIVANLYRRVAELEELFPGRRFTLDGHVVGSIGEALASERYGLELLPALADTHDAVAPDGRLVQIRATQRRRVAMYSEPEHLLVHGLREDGSVVEIHNGPGAPAWAATGPRQKNGQCTVAVSKLVRLMDEVPDSERIPQS